MSEAEATTTTEAPAAVAAEGNDAAALAAAEAIAPPVAETAAPVETEDEVDLDNAADDDVFADPAKARALAEKYRAEAAKNRVKAREASEKANDWAKGWTPEDAAVLSDVIQLAAADPKVGAAKMREIADLLDKGDAQGAAAVAAEASEDAAEAAKALTADDVDAKVKEALDAAETTRAIEKKRDEIVSRCKELGYEPGTDDYFTVLHIASNEMAGDLEKAHEKIEARNQAVIDAYVAGVRERAAGQPLHARRGEESVIEPTGENKTWDSARERVEARLLALKQGEQK